MRRLLVIIAIIVLNTTLTNAQAWKRAPLEVFGGISNFHYFGDIGGAPTEANWLGLRDISFKAIRPGLHLGARYQVSKETQIKGSYSLGIITQTDANSLNEDRNFAFKTTLHEFSVSGEYYLIPESDENYYYSIMQVRGGLRHFRQPFSLYLTGGLGGIYYSVTPLEALVNSPRFSGDQTLAMVIPVGIGAKYVFMPKISLGAELVGKYTTSNNIDGFASEYGQHNDIYYSLIIKVNYKIQRARKPSSYRRKRFLFF
ncbi:MAG: DUF6089 family protein [Bacteroidales bacterium]